MALCDAFGVISVTALVDEATGFQEERERDELRKILAAYISPQLMQWIADFTPQLGSRPMPPDGPVVSHGPSIPQSCGSITRRHELSSKSGRT
jgi:hypothetical protein